jgi:hypothetical protein
MLDRKGNYIMANFSEDPIVNVIHNGLKESINIVIQNRCYHAAIILILSGIDTMAYLNMPDKQENVERNDFVKWVEKYIKFPCEEQLTGLDLYGARCAMLHTLGVRSRLSKKGKCRIIAYKNRGVPEIQFNPTISKEMVVVSIEGLRDAFFKGINTFLIDIFKDKYKAPIAEERLKEFVHTLPYNSGN